MPRGAPYQWLSPGERELIRERLRAGERVAELVVEFGASSSVVYRLRGELALRRRRCSGRWLSFEERERISRGVAAGESDAQIARALRRHRCTVGREIQRNGGRCRYRALLAQRRAVSCARRPKVSKLWSSERLLAAVEAGLERRFSPGQISARLKLDHPADPEMRISHETIYQSLYVQSRGELRRQLAANLRTRRARRRPRGIPERRGRIPEMVPISARPPEVEDRAVPGHWEGDLLVGAYGRSAIATLVERHTRYVLLARLGYDRTTEHVIAALKQRIQTLPAHLVQSLTWDQGKEMTAHKQFSIDTGIEVYFCDPHSPWQRGSNENTNGLLRQYLPRKHDLAARSQVELDQIAAELNGRPRKTLNWATPAERMDTLLR